jgi:uncharacterized membrane protein
MSVLSSQYIPQTGPNRRPVMMWLVVAILALLFIATILAAPLAAANGYLGFSTTVYLAFSHFCHQIPERSFFIAGHQFAVCARCTGIYFGFAAAALAYPVFRSLRQTSVPPRKLLFVAAAPLGIDWAVEVLGIWHNTHSSRFLTGALLGATSVFYVLPGLIELSLRSWSWRKPKPEKQVFSLPVFPRAAPSDYSAPERRI